MKVLKTSYELCGVESKPKNSGEKKTEIRSELLDCTCNLFTRVLDMRIVTYLRYLPLLQVFICT